jgi:hypothetical protein
MAITKLDVVTYRDGTPIPEVTDATEWENLKTGPGVIITMITSGTTMASCTTGMQ